MQAENVIDVKNLSLKAGYRYLLKDINWQVARGEHWLLFGMNGSGKTTLLSIPGWLSCGDFRTFYGSRGKLHPGKHSRPEKTHWLGQRLFF